MTGKGGMAKKKVVLIIQLGFSFCFIAYFSFRLLLG